MLFNKGPAVLTIKGILKTFEKENKVVVGNVAYEDRTSGTMYPLVIYSSLK